MAAGMSDGPLHTPFYTACYHGQFEAARFLADSGARTALTDQALTTKSRSLTSFIFCYHFFLDP
jgi:hypothetical protein